jgi:hypothetical protein
MAGTSERRRDERNARGSVPLAIKLQEAIRLVELVNERASGTATYDFFSQLVGNTRTSSSFQRKVSALRQFGLADDRENVVALSGLGNRIANPSSPEDRLLAIREAFLRIDVLSKMFERHKGKLLPEDVFLTNIVFQEMDLPKDLAAQWVDGFRDAVKAAGLLYERADGKTQLLEFAAAADNGGRERAQDSARGENQANRASEVSPLSDSTIPIPLGLGRTATVRLPHDWNAKRDLSRFIRMLELALGDVSEPDSEAAT